MSGGRDLEQQARKFLNLPELRAAWTSTQTTMFNILVEFGAALRAETPAPREILNDAIQCAARDLPERWRIEIVVEKGSGWANIYDPKDDCLPDSVTGVSPDFDLEEQVRYLTKWAAGEPEQAK